jgi:hypothetical protein
VLAATVAAAEVVCQFFLSSLVTSKSSNNQMIFDAVQA